MDTSIYDKPLTHITDVSPYFRYDDTKKEMIFIGNTLEVRIPERFSAFNLLEISDTVVTVGVCDLIIDDTYQASLHMLAKIEIAPSEIDSMMIDDSRYVVLTLYGGDRFICNTQVIKNKNIVYAIYVEFITRGNPIYTINYDNIATLLDQAGPMCDAKLNVDHVIFEMIYSHLYRDPNNLTVQYRHTDMSQPGVMIPLRSVAYAPTSTTSRLLGAYFSEGLNAALVNPNTKMQKIEDILR